MRGPSADGDLGEHGRPDWLRMLIFLQFVYVERACTTFGLNGNGCMGRQTDLGGQPVF